MIKVKRADELGIDEKIPDGDGHMCVNPNTCDICHKIFFDSIEATKKSDEIKRNGKKGRGSYFVPAPTW